MKKGKGLRILGIILTAIGLIGVGSVSLASSAMIVAVGIRTLSTLSVISYITAGAGVATLALGTVTGIVGSAKERSGVKLIEDLKKEKQK